MNPTNLSIHWNDHLSSKDHAPLPQMSRLPEGQNKMTDGFKTIPPGTIGMNITSSHSGEHLELVCVYFCYKVM